MYNQKRAITMLTLGHGLSVKKVGVLPILNRVCEGLRWPFGLTNTLAISVTLQPEKRKYLEAILNKQDVNY